MVTRTHTTVNSVTLNAQHGQRHCPNIVSFVGPRTLSIVRNLGSVPEQRSGLVGVSDGHMDICN